MKTLIQTENTNQENKYNLYSGNNQARVTNLTRLETIKQYNEFINKQDIIIYCSTRDFYVKGQGMKNAFLDDFLNKDSNIGKIYYDENALLLENTLRGLKFKHNGKICFVKNNNIEYIPY
jgi:hypothetical protein